MKTRIASSLDANTIASLHAQSWRSVYRGMLRDDYLDREIFAERTALWEERFRRPAPNQYVVVAEIGRQIVGFACAYGGEDARWGTFLDNLHVAPARRRHGIGGRLIADVARWSIGAFPRAEMHLWVLESNTPAIRFYEKLGGVKTGEDVWTPPDGGAYRKLRYAWPDLEALLAAHGIETP